MKVFLVVCVLVLAAMWLGAPVEASRRSLQQGSSKPQNGTKTTSPPKTTTPPKGQQPAKGRTAPTGTGSKKPANTTAAGARSGIGKFDYVSPDRPMIGRRLLDMLRLLRQTKANEKSQAKPSTTTPAKNATATPPKGQQPAKGRTAPKGTGSKANATGSGARSGIGKYEQYSPDHPEVSGPKPWIAGQGKRRSLLQGSKPQNGTKTTSPPKKDTPPKGQQPAKGRKAPAGSKNATSPAAGQGARSGIGKFDYVSPDRPMIGRR